MEQEQEKFYLKIYCELINGEMAGQLLLHYPETPCMSAIMPASVAPDQLRSTAVNLL